ncbi:MAG TPA: cupin domain-containing protein [Candidatus Angelobacter sp.]
MNLSADLSDLGLNCLDRILSPVSARAFLDHSWGQQFVHIEGYKDKFWHLFPWNQLNTALEQYPFQPPRMRLVKGGRDINAERYLFLERLGSRDQTKRLSAAELTNELKLGATLVLNCAEEVSPALRELCAGLERIFRVYVIVNLYVAFKSDNGFGLHWDDQDTFILQVYGRKKWRVFEPTRPHPLKEDHEKPGKPSVLVWDGILEEGGLFHIPRGWWHVAYPVDEPSLHLTVTVNSLTGLDFLRWYLDGLMAAREVRANLPLVKSHEDQRRYAETLKQELLNAWTPDMIERFIADRDSSAASRPVMRLPESVTMEHPVHEDGLFRLSSPRSVVIRRESESNGVSFTCDRKVWQCSQSLLPVLTLLNDGETHSFGELTAMLNGAADQSGVKQFLNQLAQGGVLIVETPVRAEKEPVHI